VGLNRLVRVVDGLFQTGDLSTLLFGDNKSRRPVCSPIDFQTRRKPLQRSGQVRVGGQQIVLGSE